MIARVAVWEPMPDDDRQWVIDAAKTVPGVLDAYHLVDPATGNGLSIAFFEDTVNVADVKAAIGKKASEIGWDDVPRPSPRSEAIYRVLRSGWRFARLTRGVRDQAHGLAGGLVRAL